jgi:hypothetical protein
MTRASTKADETQSAEVFLRLLAVEHGPLVSREAPDFEIPLRAGPRVGLEIVELADFTLARGESLVARLRDSLADRLREDGIDVRMHLSIPEGLGAELARKGALKRHEHALVALAHRHVALSAGPASFDGSALRLLGIDCVASVDVGEGSVVTIGTRAHGRGHSFVQQAIDAKNAKIAEYKGNLPGCGIWLLLRARARQRSNVWHVVVDETQEYASAFDRTFFLHDTDGLHELRTRPPT